MALHEHEANGTRPRGRTVLVTGDGSLQLTMQEIGSMVHHKMKPIIILINNAGYTIERVIHGARQSYNDIFQCDYSHMLKLFGMSEKEADESYHKATTKDEVREILSKPELQNPSRVQVVEIVMDTFDSPWRLVGQLAMRGESSIKKMKEGGFDVPDSFLKK